ncbi:MAG: phosphopentomutase [Acidobacteria bacterium RIFCSPLOWO2_12_FULL_67_14]|nr:MAG: phosphopentomutase [Acidobacteria bacterium RIFCSPLOWO2_02_FULL_67_21]OFW35845.1 MAG: phosphopentomutase [Acidobacteria bacterium RIFCSPLOWO2_12_FULL_67_14]
MTRVPPFARVILIVLDSVGIGELPDAAAYGDQGSNTLGHIARQTMLRIPNLRSLGLDRLVALGEQERTWGGSRGEPTSISSRGPADAPRGAFGRMAEASPGKDSVTGHWELMGLVLDRPFTTFPSGFPADLIAEFERRIGRRILGNVGASGTEIIERLGAEHLRTGNPIVYTSADSVFQVAAHEAVIPVDDLYRMCETAFDLFVTGIGVARVIARPFIGAPGAFTRTANRRDYALEPTGDTLLDRLAAQQIPVVAIGKIHDLFGGRGIARALRSRSDSDGLDQLETAMADTPSGLIFVNLVDFDTVYGHRNDVDGYAENLERFDARLAGILPMLRRDDLLAVTADHGNDPSTPSTDHSREYVPVLLAGPQVLAGVNLGTRPTFADLGQTIADNFGVPRLAQGTSFLDDVLEARRVEHP